MDSYKVVFIGTTKVGKTSIINRILLKQDDNPRPTPGINCFKFKISLPEPGKDAEFILWDTAGQEEYARIVPLSLKGAKFVVIVFDINNKSTYDDISRWYEEINETSDPPIIAILGNKCDLDQAITESMFSKLLTQFKPDILLRTSAITGEGIDNFILQMVTLSMEISQRQIQENYFEAELRKESVSSCC